MGDPHPAELRERVVAAYCSGEGAYAVIAARFGVGEASVKRWVWRHRDHGHFEPKQKGGGTPSPVGATEIERLLDELRDATANELTAAYNRSRRGRDRVHVSSIKRALHRHGYTAKKRCRPLECLRPDVQAKRAAYLKLVKRIPVERLVFLDESGMNLSMTRTHAWVKRGFEFVERVPMNWGTNLTVLGAIRLSGWVALTTMFQTANKTRFLKWLKRVLLPKLSAGDVVVMDNLPAHKDPAVAAACEARGVRALYLPPYSPDLNPIEPGWALQKQYVRRHAPRQPDAPRHIARRARHRATSRHCRGWFQHAGYLVQLR